MGKVTDMNADEYESMDMLIGPSGDQCGSGANKYKFYMWKKVLDTMSVRMDFITMRL